MEHNPVHSSTFTTKNQPLIFCSNQLLTTEGEDLDQDLEDLIDDREVVDDEDDDNDEESGKRAHEDSELEEDLEDEDYDLIEENLGIKVKKHKVCTPF